MASVMSPEEVREVIEFVKRVAENNQRKSSNAAALEAAREQIRERGQFIPKELNPPQSIQISF